MLKKRILCLVLALTMMLSMMPATPFIASAVETQPTEITYDELVGAINTVLDKITNMGGGERRGLVLLLEDSVETDEGIANLQDKIRSIDSDNNGVLDELPEGEKYYFGEATSLKILNTLTSKGYTVGQAAQALGLLTIWNVGDRVELVKSLDSDNPIQFFATTYEINKFNEELLDVFPDFGQLLEAQDKSIDEFSFFAFAARQAIGSSIFTDKGLDGESIKFIDDDRFDNFKNKISEALGGNEELNIPPIIVKGKTFNEETINELFASFENVLNQKVNDINDINDPKVDIKKILGNYGLYQPAKLPSIRLVPVYGIIDNEDTVDVDVVLEYMNSDINDINLHTFGLNISYSDKLSLQDVKKNGNSVLSEDYDLSAGDSVEMIDADIASRQITYGFAQKGDTTFTVANGTKTATILTLEFLGVEIGRGNLEVVGDVVFIEPTSQGSADIVFNDYSGDTTQCAIYNSVIDVRDATVLPTRITNVYVDGKEVQKDDTISIASNDFTVKGFVDPRNSTVRVNNHIVEVSEDKGEFTYDFTGITSSQVVTINAGNDTFAFTVNVDTVGPVINVTNVENGGLYNVNKTITINYGDDVNVTLASATLNGNDVSDIIENNGATTQVDNAEEDFVLIVVAKDALGNETTKTVNFTIDKIAPEITIVGAESGGATSIIIGATEGTVVATLYDVINNEPVNGRNYSNDTLITDSGDYRLVVTATDAAENETTETVDFTIDGVAPGLVENSVSITVGGNDASTVKGTPNPLNPNPNEQLNISFDVTETLAEGYLNVGYIDIRMPITDTNKTVNYNYTIPSDVSAKGVPVTALLIDSSGNRSELIDLGTITIDNTDPKLFAHIDKETQYGYIKDDSVTVTIETDGNQITYDVLEDGNSIENDTKPTSEVSITIDIANKNNKTYTVEYSATDVVGNTANDTLTFTVDNVKPNAPTINNVTTPTNQNSVTLDGTTDLNTIILVKENNTPLKASKGLPVEVNLHTGLNSFMVYAVDKALNISPGSDVIRVVKDVRNPLISIDKQDDGSLLAVSNEELDNNTLSIVYEKDGNAVNTATITPKNGVDNTYEIGGVGLAQAGKHAIKVTANDLAGNTGFGKLTSVTVAKEITEKLPIDEKTNIEEADFEKGGTLEVNSVVAAAEEGKEFVAQPMDFSGVQVAKGKSVVIDIDLGKNLPESTKLWYLDEKDDTNPLNDEWIELNGNIHGDSIYNPTDPAIVDYKLDADEEGNGVIYNGDTYEVKTVTVEAGHLVAVLHHFSTYGPMADTTAPKITITSPEMSDVINEGNLVDGKLVVTGTLSEECETVTIDNGTVITDATTGNAFTANIDVIQDNMTITVSAIDLAGNESTETVDIFVDTELPDITTFSAIERTRNNPENLTLKVSDTNGVVAKIYETSVAEENLVYTTTNKDTNLTVPVHLEQGNNSFIAVLTDEYGNSATNETLNIFLDSIPPTITIKGVSDGNATANDVEIEVELSESGTWSAVLDANGDDLTYDATFNNSPYTVSAVNEQEVNYVLGITAEDALGNMNYEELTFTIDTTLPTIDIDGIEDKAITNQSITIDVTSNAGEENITYALTKDGESVSFNNGELSDEGVYKLIIIATNTNNGKVATKTVNFTIDKVAPEIKVTGVSNGGTYTSSATPVITVTDTNLDSELTTIKLDGKDYVSGTAVTDKATHTLAITATDKAGNEATKEITFTVRKASTGGGGGSSSPSTTTKKTVKVTTKGGTFEMLSDEVVLKVAKDTFGEKVSITVEVIEEDIPALPAQTKTTKLMLVGKVYDFDAKGKTFNKPVEVTLSYDKDKVDDASKLGIYVYNETTDTWDYVGGKVDAKNGTVTVTLNHFSKYAVMGYEKTFTDVTSHWAKEDIELMAARHIANGMTTTTFAPQGKITRAQFATLLVRALGLEISTNSNTFDDVNDEWFAGYVTTAYEAGLVNGMSATKFAPEANVTREQMATMIMRAYSNKTNNDYNNIATTTDVRFNDETEINSWAHHAVLIANDLSIINGMGNDMFAPKADATRAQAIVMIKRLLEATDSL